MADPVVLALGRDRVAVPAGTDLVSVGRWWALRLDVPARPSQAHVAHFEEIQAALQERAHVLPVRFGWRPRPEGLRALLRDERNALDRLLDEVAGCVEAACGARGHA